MKHKSPAVQWYPKQYLGDDKVLAMEWDARGMHVHLLNISWQQEPPGSIPNDMAMIRRWLGSPSDDVWRRVKSQIFSAWSLQDDRWFNSGMVRAWVRQKVHRENAAKREQTLEDEDVNRNIPSLGEVKAYCEERKNGIDPQQWFDFYTSKGWMIGKNRMKDWRAAVRTWERNGAGRSKETGNKAAQRLQALGLGEM